MAEGRLAPALFETQEHDVSAPSSADFLYLYGRSRKTVKSEPKRYLYPEYNATPTNEYGVALPIFTQECNCGSCSYTRHHLHSTEPLFRAAGAISTQFRELATLSVWSPRCRHNEQHLEYHPNTFLPDIEIMEQCIYEEKILRGITMNANSVEGVSRVIDDPLTDTTALKGLNRWRENLMAERPELLKKIGDIVVTPEELVTGALLLAAPNHARSRLIEGKGYVLTGLLPRGRINDANDFAQQVLIEHESSVQTEENELELAA